MNQKHEAREHLLADEPAVLKQARDDVANVWDLLGSSPDGTTRAIYASALVTAHDRIAELEKQRDHWRDCFICVECGRGKADEDGCCTTCGMDVLIFENGKLTRPLSHFYDMDAIEKEARETDAALTSTRAEVEALRGEIARASTLLGRAAGCLMTVTDEVEAMAEELDNDEESKLMVQSNRENAHVFLAAADELRTLATKGTP